MVPGEAGMGRCSRGKGNLGSKFGSTLIFTQPKSYRVPYLVPAALSFFPLYIFDLYIKHI